MFSSVSNKIGLLVFGVLVLTLTSMILVMEHKIETSTLDLAEENVKHVTNLTHNFINFAMSEGLDNVQPIIENIKNMEGIRDIRITPTNFIKENSENDLDQTEKDVLKNLEAFSSLEEFNDEPVIRYVLPLLSTKSCIHCHEGNVGQPLAVISARISLEKVMSSIAAQKQLFIILGLFTLFATAGLTFFLVRKLVARPIQENTCALDKLASGDVVFDLETKSSDEIGTSTKSLITLQKIITEKSKAAEQISLGNLSVEIVPESDKDILGHSMLTMKESINNMVKEINDLITQALAGHLQVRADEGNHEGEFRTIIKGVNNILDAVVDPINEAANVLNKIAGKDLTERVLGQYKGDHAKIKNAVNTAIETLNQNLLQVAIESKKVASASMQIGTGSQIIAQGASDQASSLEEVTANLHEMAEMTKLNTQSTMEARQITEAARNSAEKSRTSMERLSSAMKKIENSSNRTSKIIHTIDEIAFQTNLLALNAAVEAARAGESGKGFAVVAEEVRTLAMRSAEAAKDTSETIVDSINSAQEGVALNKEVLTNLDEIHSKVNQVNEVMAMIADASSRQSEGIEQINVAVKRMNETTQKNAAGSEESASAAEQLAGQAEEMTTIVSSFKLDKSLAKIRQEIVPSFTRKFQEPNNGISEKKVVLEHY